MKKWFLWLVVGLLIVMVGGVLLVAYFFDSMVKQGIETAGPMLTKTSIKVDSVSIRPFAGTARLRGLQVANPEGYQPENAIQVGDVDIALKVASLMSDTIEIQHVRVVAPKVRLEGGLKENNLTKILANVEAASGSAGTNQAAAAQPGKKLRIGELSVTDGKVALALALLAGKPTEVALPAIQLRDLGSGEQGLTAAELSKRLLAEVLKGVTLASTDVVGNLAKGLQGLQNTATGTLGKEMTNQVGTAVKGVTDLLKRKK